MKTITQNLHGEFYLIHQKLLSVKDINETKKETFVLLVQTELKMSVPSAVAGRTN